MIAELLAEPGPRICTSPHTGDDAILRARHEPFDLVISDINLKRADSGLDVLRAFKRANPGGQVVLISGFGTLETAIEAVRAGAFDYISKPFDIGEVQGDRRAGAGATAPRLGAGGSPPASPSPAGLVGRTAAMLAVYKQIAHAADSAAPGADHRRERHRQGAGRARRSTTTAAGRRVRSSPINCGALAETLLESELFGHVRGAFTGAIADTQGRVRAGARRHGVPRRDRRDVAGAAGEAAARAAGGRGAAGRRQPHRAAWTCASSPRPTSTSRRAVAEQRFRQDLFYRLSVIVIELPPLRERREDIPLLVEQFLQNALRRATGRPHRRSRPRRSPRSRRNAGRATSASSRTRSSGWWSSAAGRDRRRRPAAQALAGKPTLLEERCSRICRRSTSSSGATCCTSSHAVGGNRSRAAEVLGIDRRTLYRMAERFGIDLKDEATGGGGVKSDAEAICISGAFCHT